MCVGETRTDPTGAPYPTCASGFRIRSLTPGAPRELSACSRQRASKLSRIASVPITVIGLPRLSRAGRIAVASPVGVIFGLSISSAIATPVVGYHRHGHSKQTMPDSRRHRGPHPEDRRLFHADRVGDLQKAVGDFSLLLSKDYATPSALKLVGDHFNLTERQRTAIQRASCSDKALINRRKTKISFPKISDQPLLIDGYNILTTLETALSGGPIFACRDGCFRDMASIHGTYRKVEETIPALNLLADFLSSANCGL